MNGEDLAAISKRVYGGFAKPPWPALKRHLFNAMGTKKLLRALRALCVKDKRVGLTKKDCFRE